ncbi:hypothetical protein QQF64_025775, partial [Cirrhinus molitorella]
VSSLNGKSPDLTAGSTDAFWSFDSCATILGQPAVQSLEEDAGHRPEQRRSTKESPPPNLVLKNLCESFLMQRNEKRSSGSEEICSLHSEKLKLFCLEDKQPVCLVCVNSQTHVNHTFRPIDEVVPSYKEELNTALKSLQEKLQHKEKMKGEFQKTVKHIKSQAEHTERQIKQQFEKLHQFLRDEEEATITALREEEEQKKQMMKKKLKEINRHISALSHTIKDTVEMMKASDICFLKEFPVSMERVQISQPDPQTPSGALIHVPRYLGNLPFRVWKKMQDIVQNTPVILDPNTAHQCLVVSDDLTRMPSHGSISLEYERDTGSISVTVIASCTLPLA